MPHEVHVHLLPEHFSPERLRGSLAVVIDVLRASTTIVQALASGAEAVVPFAGVDEARAFAQFAEGGRVLLGGERGGTRIPGFDLDNSPLAYTAEAVAGRTIAFTTTNGTRALARCREASRVLVGAFVNLSAIAKAARSDGHPVHLVCAGTDGQATGEDVLCAGAIATGLCDAAGGISPPDDLTRMAMELYSLHGGSPDDLLRALCNGAGGRNLIDLGLTADIEQAARRDVHGLVPEYEGAAGRIVPISALW